MHTENEVKFFATWLKVLADALRSYQQDRVGYNGYQAGTRVYKDEFVSVDSLKLVEEFAWKFPKAVLFGFGNV